MGAAYQLDLSTGVIKWNDQLYTDYGYGPSDPTAVVEWWTEHIHPEDAMILNQAMDSLANPRAEGWTVEYRFRKADNTYVPVIDRATVQRNESGAPVHLTGTLTPKES